MAVAAEARVMRTPVRESTGLLSKPPLPGLPVPRERRTHPFLVSVAAHELNHALVAFDYGIPILSISVNQDPTSLGRTILAGHVDVASFQTIAAAGSLHTSHGHAEGYGSDMFKVHLFYHYGGISAETAQARAASVLSRYPSDIRTRAAEILAYKGEVVGSELGAILRHAEWELANERLERAGNSGGFLIQRPAYEQESGQNKLSSHPIDRDVTIVDNLKGPNYKIVHIATDGSRKISYICKECGGENGHYKGCKILEQRQTSLRRTRRVTVD